MSLANVADVTSAPGGEFAIPATTSLQERRPRTLKHGDTFAVFDPRGDVHSDRGVADGMFHRDTRYLSRFELALAGVRPMLLSSTLRDDNTTLTCDLTNPDLENGDGRALEHDLIHIRRSKFLYDATCFERLAIRNFSDQPQLLALDIGFDADFADLFEVRGARRPRRGQRHPALVTADTVVRSYTGLDGRRRATRFRFDPPPDVLRENGARFNLHLPSRGRAVIYVEIRCDQEAPSERARDLYLTSLVHARRGLRYSASRAAAVQTSNTIFNEAICRSVSDLYMLMTDTPEGPYPYAGIPWFSTAFGRDALITAIEMLWMDPLIARGVLRFLAANQAREVDPVADAEPGKILHEIRHGEMAELGEVPFRRYYGSVDATPLFVMVAGAYLERTADVATARELWPNVEAALAWIDGFGDRDGDGFVEYFRMTENGLANQGWKDSHDSVFHADGSLAVGPIALVEVQAYVYAAKRNAARIARALDLPARAQALESQAEFVRRRVDDAFWCDELGTYALALDGEKRPCRVRSSNAGHVMMSGLASSERAERVASQLLGSTFFSGWGVRTVASSESRYNPMSYHNGSVWPHDNAMIAVGLGRYGMRQQAAHIFDGLFDACTYIDLRRLPELFCGFPRRGGQGPTFYPVACAPQAWAAGAPISLLQSCLGLGFDAPTRTVFFDRPVLPRFMNEVVLRGLEIGDARIDVGLSGTGGRVAMTVLSRAGNIRATMTS